MAAPAGVPTFGGASHEEETLRVGGDFPGTASFVVRNPVDRSGALGASVVRRFLHGFILKESAAGFRALVHTGRVTSVT